MNFSLKLREFDSFNLSAKICVFTNDFPRFQPELYVQTTQFFMLKIFLNNSKIREFLPASQANNLALVVLLIYTTKTIRIEKVLFFIGKVSVRSQRSVFSYQLGVCIIRLFLNLFRHSYFYIVRLLGDVGYVYFSGCHNFL